MIWSCREIKDFGKSLGHSWGSWCSPTGDTPMANIEKRNGTYRVKVRLKGHPTQNATFQTLTEAKRWAQSIEAAIRERRYFPATEAKQHTLADLIDRYSQDVLPHKS